MRTDDYIRKLSFRIKHRLEDKAKWHVRAYILFLEAEMKSDYYAFKIGWEWMFR